MRLYNGCPDKELQALIDSREEIKREAKSLGYGIVWFPVEEKYGAHILLTYEPVGPLCYPMHKCLEYIKENVNASRIKSTR